MKTSNTTLDEKLTGFEEQEFIERGVKDHIKQNLHGKFPLRRYQEKVFERFYYYVRNFKGRPNPTQLLFHMATGSGKTLIMAGLILDLYKLGYRNFIFFVHSTNIIEKTRDNFLNSCSSKFLFNDTINIDNQKIEIREVENFEAVGDYDINIVFTTIQGLHAKLNAPRENSLVYEDFEHKKIVLISDEAHHINAETKKGKRTSKDQKHIDSWEGTVTKILKSNKNNYLLEFTATVDFGHYEIKGKYDDKLIYNYPLKQFRIDGYSKEVSILKLDTTSPFKRTLRALILSQLRRKIFEAHKIHIKPVILLKSKTKTENKSFYEYFAYNIKKLNVNQLNQIKEQSKSGIIKIAFDYFENKEISLDNLVLELKEDFSEEKCLRYDSDDDKKKGLSQKKQLIVNRLEDLDNEYRLIFAVDKLNEGWDVLNLFDIVRLYDSGGNSKNKTKIDLTTMSEAQLIGRGARYCPFQISQDQSRFQRKFDSDIKNDLRICEELFYHASYNPRYISDLKKAFKRLGDPDILGDNQSKKVTLNLKDNFKSTIFYKYGVVFENKRIDNKRTEHKELEAEIRNKLYKFKFSTGKSVQHDVFENEEDNKQGITRKTKIYYIKDFSKQIIRKAINKSPFYTFKNLKSKYPYLNSITEFIEHENYLGRTKIELSGNQNQVQNPSNQMKLKATLNTLNKIKIEIEKGYSTHIGTEKFFPKAIAKVFKDKTKTISEEGEFGIPQSKTTDEDLYINLKNEDWYVYNENFGTSEEKHLVKYIKSIYEEYLKDNFEIYLIRNENDTKLFTFDKGIRFEPDFLFFLIDRKTSKQITYQIFMESKGEHLISNENSKSKEKFLGQIADAFRLDTNISNREEVRLIGMPLYNKEKTALQFDVKFKELIPPQA